MDLPRNIAVRRLATTWAALIACILAARSAPAADQPVDYTREIKPQLADHCFVCHGPTKQKSGLRLDTAAAMLAGGKRGAVVVPGNPAGEIDIRAKRANQPAT